MFSNNVAKGKQSQEFKTIYKQIPEVWLKMVIASVVKKHYASKRVKCDMFTNPLKKLVIFCESFTAIVSSQK